VWCFKLIWTTASPTTTFSTGWAVFDTAVSVNRFFSTLLNKHYSYSSVKERRDRRSHDLRCDEPDHAAQDGEGGVKSFTLAPQIRCLQNSF
jgi:hypothetical protein